MKRYKCYYTLKNGLTYAQKPNGKCGLLFSSSILLNFKYYAISIFQNDYAFGLLERKNKDGINLYDCQVIKARFQLDRSDSVFPLEKLLFENKTKEEVDAYFADNEQLSIDCASFMSYGYYIKADKYLLQFFPFDTLNEREDDEENIGGMIRKEYDFWEHYSIDDSLYDALGGDMEAIWNID